MKNLTLKITLLLALLILPTGIAYAANLEAGNNVYVTKDQIISGNFFATGDTITVDGTINGDLISAAKTINVNGRVDGDIISIAQNINVNGEVGGNIRVAANSLTLNGTVGRNLSAAANDIVMGPNSAISWDALIMAVNTEIRGNIEGSLSGKIGQGLIAGKIGKNVTLTLSNTSKQPLIISPDAVIGGNLNYNSKIAANISDKSVITGSTTQKNIPTEKNNWLQIYLWANLFSIFSALVVGLVLIFIGKNISSKILAKLEKNPTKLIVPGIIVSLILPPIALLLLFTVIGIPLAMIIMAWWLVMTYVAKILTAILVGSLIIKAISKKDKASSFWSLVLGVFICWLLFTIPFVGWILGLIAIWLGLGGIYSYASNQLRNI
ncbi:MAG: bactofilin family protein [Patescibacteria group bacterium]